jgi:hypothetical protein
MNTIEGSRGGAQRSWLSGKVTEFGGYKPVARAGQGRLGRANKKSPGFHRGSSWVEKLYWRGISSNRQTATSRNLFAWFAAEYPVFYYA